MSELECPVEGTFVIQSENFVITEIRPSLKELNPRTPFGNSITMMTDPIADMLTRIRNAVRIERPIVQMPHSKVKRGLAEVLKREGYIWDWHEEDAETAPGKAALLIDLKYGPNGERVIRHIKRVSKPGRRVYSRANALRPILERIGNLDHQHQSRSGERSRSPTEEPGRRSFV